MQEHEIFAFIPARGGSKRLPRKNIKMLAGKPMLAWKLEACKKSKYIQRTFVSTEDAEIKKVALDYGAEVVDRPAEFSRDDLAAGFAMDHWRYMHWKKEGYMPKSDSHVVSLSATSPMVTEKHIDEAIEKYLKSKSRMLISLCIAKRVPFLYYFINDMGLAEVCLNKQEIWRYDNNLVKGGTRKIIYFCNSAVQICPYYVFCNDMIQSCSSLEYYIMSAEDSIDVDTPFDFAIAEMLLKERIKKGEK